MTVAILGTGDVGRTLGRAWLARGRDVVYGSRTPESAAVPDGARVATNADAAARGDVVVLAVPGRVVVDLAGGLADELAGTPTVDVANELDRPAAGESLAERVADAAPDARVVKAFNVIGTERMADPDFDGVAATIPVCGDHPPAVDAAADLAKDLGFDVIRAGGLSAAVHLEDLARFWIHLSDDYGRDIGFRLLRG